MTLLRQSQLPRLLEPSAFFWTTGIEDTFITAPCPKTGRTLDEYELTDHYRQYASDLGLMRESGVSAARYGIPWHRIQPGPNEWQWDFTDRALERLLALGIEPIVDLVHYGLPLWIENAYLNPEFPRYMAEYATRVAERFRGRIFAYTPLNEPRITAWYCGRLGWWPPYRHGWGGFVAVMLGACRGIVDTVHALKAVDPEITIAHVDATDLYHTDDPSLLEHVRHRQELVFLPLDLVSGRIHPGHPLWSWLLQNGATPEHLEWFQERALTLSLLGINLYPMFTGKTGQRTRTGGVRWKMSYAPASILEKLGTLYWERYKVPIFVAETASVGSVSRRQAWLVDSVAAVRRLRERGVPLVGYTWWPLFALVTWAYRQGAQPAEFYLKQMGLWDLDSTLRRIRTSLVDEFQALTEAGAKSVGDLTSSHPDLRVHL